MGYNQVYITWTLNSNEFSVQKKKETDAGDKQNTYGKRLKLNP